MVGRTPGGQKGVGTFSGGGGYFLLGSVRHRLQRAPEEEPVNAGLCAHFQAWGARGKRGAISRLLPSRSAAVDPKRSWGLEQITAHQNRRPEATQLAGE